LLREDEGFIKEVANPLPTNDAQRKVSRLGHAFIIFFLRIAGRMKVLSRRRRNLYQPMTYNGRLV
jgi:hypothetical protein